MWNLPSSMNISLSMKAISYSRWFHLLRFSSFLEIVNNIVHLILICALAIWVISLLNWLTDNMHKVLHILECFITLLCFYISMNFWKFVHVFSMHLGMLSNSHKIFWLLWIRLVPSQSSWLLLITVMKLCVTVYGFKKFLFQWLNEYLRSYEHLYSPNQAKRETEKTIYTKKSKKHNNKITDAWYCCVQFLCISRCCSTL